MKLENLVLIGLAFAAATSQAQDSVYTELNDETCQSVYEDPEVPGTVLGLRCAGHGDWAIYRRLGEHGEASAYSQGRVMPVHLDYGGYVGNFGNYHGVLEWRLDAEGTPIATIHRYHSAVVGDGVEMDSVSILIVTALRPGENPESCHVGYVAAYEVGDANAQARSMADEIAPRVDCENHQLIRIDASNAALD